MSVLMGNTIDNSGHTNRANMRVGQSATRLDVMSKANQPQANGPHQGERVSFSDSVALMQRLQGQIDAQPAVRADKVLAARMAIADGSFHIDYDQIAAALLKMDKELP